MNDRPDRSTRQLTEQCLPDATRAIAKVCHWTRHPKTGRYASSCARSAAAEIAAVARTVGHLRRGTWMPVHVTDNIIIATPVVSAGPNGHADPNGVVVVITSTRPGRRLIPCTLAAEQRVEECPRRRGPGNTRWRDSCGRIEHFRPPSHSFLSIPAPSPSPLPPPGRFMTIFCMSMITVGVISAEDPEVRHVCARCYFLRWTEEWRSLDGHSNPEESMFFSPEPEWVRWRIFRTRHINDCDRSRIESVDVRLILTRSPSPL
jgi:hypothetical protein